MYTPQSFLLLIPRAGGKLDSHSVGMRGNPTTKTTLPPKGNT